MLWRKGHRIILNALFFCSLLGVALVLFIYPTLILLLGRFKPQGRYEATATPRSVSIITVLRDAPELAVRSIQNLKEMDYPPDKLELVLYEDGKTREMQEAVADQKTSNVRLAWSDTHQGKISGLNAAVPLATGEILVFKDADSVFLADSLSHLLCAFADPKVGGVCGRRVIGEKTGALREGQSLYISFDSAIKEAESRLGSISSNDGKIYAIRKELYRPLPPGVTDDLCVCLDIVRQGRSFTYAPQARALIATPSRDVGHELVRRRRIVAGSLRCLFSRRDLLNPFRYGLYSLRLGVNKLLRRCLPLFFLVMLIASVPLALQNVAFGVILAMEVGLLFLAAWSIMGGKLRTPRLLTKCSEAALYFCVGNLGTLLGIMDVLKGKQPLKWDPKKRG